MCCVYGLHYFDSSRILHPISLLRLEKEQETLRWRSEHEEYLQDCLDTMRSYIPPFIFHATHKHLTEVDHMHAGIAKRILTKKCLWLVRLTKEDISKLHVVELSGRYMHRVCMCIYLFIHHIHLFKTHTSSFLLLRLLINNTHKHTHIIHPYTGRFNPEAQGLDIVETAAIFCALPTAFTIADGEGKKERWRAGVEQQVKEMLKQMKAGMC